MHISEHTQVSFRHVHRCFFVLGWNADIMFESYLDNPNVKKTSGNGKKSNEESGNGIEFHTSDSVNICKTNMKKFDSFFFYINTLDHYTLKRNLQWLHKVFRPLHLLKAL